MKAAGLQGQRGTVANQVPGARLAVVEQSAIPSPLLDCCRVFHAVQG